MGRGQERLAVTNQEQLLYYKEGATFIFVVLKTKDVNSLAGFVTILFLGVGPNMVTAPTLKSWMSRKMIRGCM